METKVKLTDWRVEDYLKTAEAQTEFILAAIEEGDPVFIAQSLAEVARVKGNVKVGALMDGIAAALMASTSMAVKPAPRAARGKARKRTPARA